MSSKISGISTAKIDENRVVIPKNSKQRVAWWRVTLGKKITGAKKVRRFFSKEKEAKEFIEKTLETRQIEGHEAFILTPGVRSEARKCQEMLDAAGAKAGRRLTLTEAVGFFLRHALPQGGTRDFEKASVDFLAGRKTKNLKERYLVNLRSQFKQLAKGFTGKKVNVITSPMLESWLAEQTWSPKTRNNYVVTLRTFFDFCTKQKWCAENPAEELEKAESEDSVAGILTIPEAARLLDVAKEFPDILPTFAIQLFAGLRRSEACALDWAEVRGKVIEVTAAKAKTRSRRVVDIQPNLATWLKPLRETNGPIFDRGEDAYNERLRELVTAANAHGATQTPPLPIIEWKRNWLRHTCASMHLAYFENDGYTALQMGHSVDVLHRHYKGLVSKDEAAQFWKLRRIKQKAQPAPRPKAIAALKDTNGTSKECIEFPPLRAVSS